ncbi:hypothetical protein ATI61_108383 [Archangium gephyra]|uniref:DUF1795 domain-containing protein n=1 Tax=Archangium gephyra TaxID=48 RepID=A0AAC8Q762_9BACT|nr:hypothetical protein [Archangium gephyra]AKJ02227.1 Hypothetical protein AA314_03853 [Archangium gephyra]REG28841.1 hypothetical protein ATI61_108383 [Archangium gephyra]
MRRAYAPLIATLCLFAAPVLAEQFTDTQSGLQFDIPRGWTHKLDGNTLTALSPDETAMLLFFVTDISESDEVVDRVAESMDQVIQNAQVTRRLTIREVNDLKQIQAKGTGTCEEDLCNWDFTLVVGARRNLLVVALGDVDKHEAEIHGVYRSIQNDGSI